MSADVDAPHNVEHCIETKGPPVERLPAVPSCPESFMSSPTSSHNTSDHLQVTPSPKTRKIKNLRSSVSKYTYNIAKRPGFCENSVKCLKSQTSRTSESDRLCVLSIDEMCIKPGLTYGTDLDSVDGFTTVRKHDFKEPSFATLALVFMASRIVKNRKQVIINLVYFT
ncbi:hypothetical protein AVEN_229682-1 [Araneus ventricosus]|uniref:Transposable element P transposase-like RNase H domain-containing protein n=1 Tax=Araneus ventricosus TaxID=182803 RepID=A0A4Y2DJU1_ARAVE|nr:hypothetical protein AVEN_229682-1 [Araneus ventricosus]